MGNGEDGQVFSSLSPSSVQVVNLPQSQVLWQAWGTARQKQIDADLTVLLQYSTTFRRRRMTHRQILAVEQPQLASEFVIEKWFYLLAHLKCQSPQEYGCVRP